MTQLEPYQQRMVDDRDALSDRIRKACGFMKSPKYAQLGTVDLLLFDMQLSAMEQYQRILGARIDRFMKHLAPEVRGSDFGTEAEMRQWPAAGTPVQPSPELPKASGPYQYTSGLGIKRT